MISKAEITLIYQANAVKENGSPYLKELEKTVTCDINKTFSNNYYMSLGRTMRTACNVVVNEYNTRDITEDGLTYQLTYAVFQGKRYKVENILNNYYNYQNDPFRKILDLKLVTV